MGSLIQGPRKEETGAAMTSLAVAENKQAMWEYNPEDPANVVLGGIDVIAVLRTLIAKVCPRLSCIATTNYAYTDHCIIAAQTEVSRHAARQGASPADRARIA